MSNVTGTHREKPQKADKTTRIRVRKTGRKKQTDKHSGTDKRQQCRISSRRNSNSVPTKLQYHEDEIFNLKRSILHRNKYQLLDKEQKMTIGTKIPFFPK